MITETSKSHKIKTSRRNFFISSSMATLGLSLAGTTLFAEESSKSVAVQANEKAALVITDLKCAIIGGSPIIRITTSEGISGYGQAESTKPYLKPYVLFYKNYLLGEDPTNVERCMLKIRRMGGFKPYGSAVSAIEMALWDIAGKAASLPVHKLLGGKVRDRVRVYSTSLAHYQTSIGIEPTDYAESVAKVKAAKEGFTIMKMPIGFHSRMGHEAPNFFYGDPVGARNQPHANRGTLTEQGLKRIVASVEAMKKVLGDEVGLALDCGPVICWQMPYACVKP
jgi:L-alanine-DL-glutamate epimerase-like enolase superfamily enzyme